MTKLLNLYGGPGVGKSTAAAQIFAGLKHRDINCEMALEYAKDKVWEESYGVLENQIYIFGKQLHRICRLIDKVDIIITDAPILMSLIYGSKESKEFHDLVRQTYHRFDNIDYFLVRSKKFQPAGRLQDEERARDLDTSISQMLLEENVGPWVLSSETAAIDSVIDNITTWLPWS